MRSCFTGLEPRSPPSGPEFQSDSPDMGPSGFESLGKREGEEDPLVLLVLGRDDLLLSGTSIRSVVLSDIDISTWRNRASLRVRYFSLAACQEPTENEDPWSPRFCRRHPTGFRLMIRVSPRLLRGFLTAGRAQIRVVFDHRLNRVTKTLLEAPLLGS